MRRTAPCSAVTSWRALKARQYTTSSPVATSKPKQQIRKICLHRRRRCSVPGSCHVLCAHEDGSVAWSFRVETLQGFLCDMIGKSTLSTTTVCIVGRWAMSLLLLKRNLPNSQNSIQSQGRARWSGAQDILPTEVAIVDVLLLSAQ